MKQWAGAVAVAVGALAGGAPVWGADPGLKAEIEVMKERLADLEQQMANQQAMADGAESGNALIQLPSGLHGIELSGYADIAYSYNFAESDPGAGRGNTGRIFDTEPGGFTPHAFKLALEKPLTDADPFGFRADLLFGDDAELIHSTGAGAAADQFDLQQAYINFETPWVDDLEFKVGKFVTLLGAEVIESPDNWNYSRSFLFGFAIPFTHTGVLASYPLGEWGSTSFGVVNGWDIVDDNNKAKSVLGNITVEPFDDFALSVSAITGAERTGDNRNDRSVVDVVATYQATDKLSFMANFDYGHESGLAQGGGPTATAGTAATDSANWTGVALYAKYDMTDTWSLASRIEWFADRDNVRTVLTGPGGTVLDDIDFYEWTLTSQWALRDNVLARLEYRHDKADERVFGHDANGFINYQDTVAAEMIYTF